MDVKLSVVILLVAVSSAAELQTRKGTVRGTTSRSRGGREYLAFYGVPYAQPPVGSLRFKNPEPHNGWEGVLDATKGVAPCMQVNLYVLSERNITHGQEDCLYLNIYTPVADDIKKVPVMVYVHGGGFRCGSPGPKEEAAFFMDEDVVLVTIQYRLGALGFLSTEDSVVPGNFGLKDQAMALKWIHDNIEDYGGDPGSIVAFGNSAGGSSVQYLMISPLSRDLLAGGISQSGVMDSSFAFAPPGYIRKYTRQAIRMVGCGTSQLLDCLQAVPAQDLIETERELIEWDFDPLTIFQPVIEEQQEGAFLTHDPRTVRATLPWITGISSGEGNFKAASLINQPSTLLESFIENMDEILTAMFYIQPGTPGLDKFLIMVKNRYFKDLHNRDHLIKQFEKLYFEFYVVYPMKKALERHAGPKYVYFLSHRAENTFSDLTGPIKLNSSKPSHGDELLSLFDYSSYFPNSKGRPQDEMFSKKLVKLWVNFAKSQSSTGGDFDNHWDVFKKNMMLNLKTEESTMEQIPLDYVVEFYSKAFSVLKPWIMRDEL